MATIIIGVLLVIAVALAIFVMRRQKRKGGSCSGGCSSCPGCSAPAACKSMGGLDSDCSRLD